MNKNHMLVLALAIIWAGYYLLINTASKTISPFVIGVAVRLGTFVILTAIIAAGKNMANLYRLNGAGTRLFCVGVLGFLLDATAFIGFRYAAADTGTVLLKTDVLMTNIITVYIYKVHFGKLDWFFTATVLVGVCLVLGINPYDLHFQPSDIFFVLSALFVTMNAFLIQHVQRKFATPNTVIAYYNNLFTLVLFSIVTTFAGHWGGFARMTEDSGLAFVLGLASVGQTLIYLFYYRCLSHLPVYIIKILLLLVPVFTMLFNVAVLGRAPTPLHLIGSALVLGSAFGILYCGRDKTRKTCAAPGKESP